MLPRPLVAVGAHLLGFGWRSSHLPQLGTGWQRVRTLLTVLNTPVLCHFSYCLQHKGGCSVLLRKKAGALNRRAVGHPHIRPNQQAYPDVVRKTQRDATYSAG